MPLVMQAYLCMVAGLLAGGLGAPTFRGALLVAALGALHAAWRRSAHLGALALVVGAGALAGRAGADAERACAARLAGAARWVVVLEEDARAGARVRGTARDGRCAARATLGVARGRAEAGRHVLVRAEAQRLGAALRLDDAVLVPLAARDRLVAWRARVSRAIDARYGRDAPLVRALVVADARAIDDAVRDRFADAGLVHALSVSGLHVAIVAAALELLLGALRLPRDAAAAVAVAAVAAYVLLLGAPAPAVRAGTMLGVQLLARVLQRPTSPWAIFALGCAAPLVEPRAVFQLDYQLSAAGMAALVAGRGVAPRLRAALTRVRERLPRLRPSVARDRAAHALAERLAPLAPAGHAVWRELVVGTIATLASAPLVAWHFGRVSAVGPLANVAAGPILALLQPTLFLGLALHPFGPLAVLPVAAARPLLAALDRVATLAAGLPGAVLHASPTLLEVALAAGGALALLAACAARRPGRPLVVAAGCVAALPWAPRLPGAGGDALELHVLDVGQGDALALRTPRGRWIVMDAGRAWRGGDAGARTVVPYVRARGGDVVALVLSHPHADHVGGAATVLRRLRPPLVWDAAFTLGSTVYRDVLDATRSTGARWRRVGPRDSLVVDGVVLRVLAPDSAWTASLDDPNLASVILSVRYREVRFLLVGDAEAEEERWLLARAARDTALAAALRADVLKVGHHGSRTSSTPDFLAAVRPRLALVSVGADNTYGHPSPEVLHRLHAGGARVLRTDRLGTIVVRTEGVRLHATSAHGGALEIPP